MMGFAEAYLEGVREFTALLQCKLLLCIYCKRLSPLTVLVDCGTRRKDKRMAYHLFVQIMSIAFDVTF